MTLVLIVLYCCFGTSPLCVLQGFNVLYGPLLFGRPLQTKPEDHSTSLVKFQVVLNETLNHVTKIIRIFLIYKILKYNTLRYTRVVLRHLYLLNFRDN